MATSYVEHMEFHQSDSNSQMGFTTTNAQQQHNAIINLGSSSGSGGMGVSLLRPSDLDDDEEYVEHSDID